MWLKKIASQSLLSTTQVDLFVKWGFFSVTLSTNTLAFVSYKGYEEPIAKVIEQRQLSEEISYYQFEQDLTSQELLATLEGCEASSDCNFYEVSTPSSINRTIASNAMLSENSVNNSTTGSSTFVRGHNTPINSIKKNKTIKKISSNKPLVTFKSVGLASQSNNLSTSKSSNAKTKGKIKSDAENQNKDSSPVVFGLTLEASKNEEVIFNLSYSDTDGDKADTCLVTPLEHVMVSTECSCQNGSCQVGLTGDSNYTGEAMAEYTVTTNQLTSNTATINVNILAKTNAVALVVANTGSLTSGELQLKSRMETLGLTVNLMDDDVMYTQEEVESNASIVLSSSISVSKFNLNGQSLSDSIKPVVTCDPELLYNLGMVSANVSGTDFGTNNRKNVKVMNNTHSITSGLILGNMDLLTTPKSVAYGNTYNVNAQLLVNLAADTRSALFLYDKGVAMPGKTAPAERVHFPCYDESISKYSSEAWTLFDNTLLWSVSKGSQ